ncbi:hypothetical protein Acy02nite_82210 [Actinoplanes cyaneus]|uniref:Uncharacterized protein n=1 Tax=Actinoplanes cyaneus TaxID=52696 RepID=A0A919M5E0_9ACTN|nr:hypothetical protein [Actinoplanes cyaneus]MCW2143486.1 hypothetical protein [Actinoplanes cyaneus]GID70340.1 hypothetical protein Acy02nite_82210 [Actinoplanes cyaneus]
MAAGCRPLCVRTAAGLRWGRRLLAALVAGTAVTAALVTPASPARADANWDVTIDENKIYDKDPWPFKGQ